MAEFLFESVFCSNQKNRSWTVNWIFVRVNITSHYETVNIAQKKRKKRLRLLEIKTGYLFDSSTHLYTNYFASLCSGYRLFLFYFYSLWTLKVTCLEYKLVYCSGNLLCKIHVNACMNNTGFFLQFKCRHTHEITFDKERIND